MCSCYTEINMKTTVFRYNVLLKKEEKRYIAYVPTLGISDFGKTVGQAQKNVKNAIACHIEGLMKTKTEIPAPDTQEYYISQAEVSIPHSTRFSL